MTKDLYTFYSYLNTNETENVTKFITYIGDEAIQKLPDKICSSKILYNILKSYLDTYFKQAIFRQTFMEYFKWKILYSNVT